MSTDDNTGEVVLDLDQVYHQVQRYQFCLLEKIRLNIIEYVPNYSNSMFVYSYVVVYSTIRLPYSLSSRLFGGLTSVYISSVYNHPCLIFRQSNNTSPTDVA